MARRARSHRNRSPSRRRSVVVVAGVAVLALAATASLVLLHAGGSTGAPSARRAIQAYLASHGKEPVAPRAVTRVVDASTPDGHVSLYALRFANGDSGVAAINTSAGQVTGIVWGPSRCPAGRALQPSMTFVGHPGGTAPYLAGHASDAVASVRVVYADGHSIPGAVANGYFLAWVVRRGEILRAESADARRVKLVAYDATGAAIGKLEADSRLGFVRPCA